MPNKAEQRITQPHLHEVCSWFLVREQSTGSFVVHSFHQWETDLGVVELCDVCASAFVGCDRLDLDDLQSDKVKMLCLMNFNCRHD